jgi:hypothetical protein
MGGAAGCECGVGAYVVTSKAAGAGGRKRGDHAAVFEDGVAAGAVVCDGDGGCADGLAALLELQLRQARGEGRVADQRLDV